MVYNSCKSFLDYFKSVYIFEKKLVHSMHRLNFILMKVEYLNTHQELVQKIGPIELSDIAFEQHLIVEWKLFIQFDKFTTFEDVLYGQNEVKKFINLIEFISHFL